MHCIEGKSVWTSENLVTVNRNESNVVFKVDPLESLQDLGDHSLLILKIFTESSETEYLEKNGSQKFQDNKILPLDAANFGGNVLGGHLYKW